MTATGYAAHRPGYSARGGRGARGPIAGARAAPGMQGVARVSSRWCSARCSTRWWRPTRAAPEIAAATPHPRVRYAVAPAEVSSLPDASVDCAVAAQAAHWFNLEAYYREVRRVARPGGLVALVTYAVLQVDPELERVIDEFYRKTLDGHWPAERQLVEEGYRSLPFPFEPVEAPALALEHRWNADQLLGYVGTWSAVQSLKKVGRGADLERFGAELRAAWGDPSTPAAHPLAAVTPARTRLARCGVRHGPAVRVGTVSPSEFAKPDRTFGMTLRPRPRGTVRKCSPKSRSRNRSRPGLHAVGHPGAADRHPLALST